MKNPAKTTRPYCRSRLTAHEIPMVEITNPRISASWGFVTPVLKGLLQVRGILASMSLSYHIFNTVLPLIARNKLPPKAKMVDIFRTGQLELIYPVRPVINSKRVWRDLISGRYFVLIVLSPIFILFISFSNLKAIFLWGKRIRTPPHCTSF